MFRNIIEYGKYSNGDIKKQRLINFIVIVGFLLQIFWIVFLIPNIFISIKTILLLLFIPSVLIALLIYKKILIICGYQSYIKNNLKYNFTIVLIVFLLISVSIGNLTVTAFLASNNLLAEKETNTVVLKPLYTGTSISQRKNLFRKKTPYMVIRFKDVKKTINFGNQTLAAIKDKSISINVSKGFFGYYIIRKYKLKD